MVPTRLTWKSIMGFTGKKLMFDETIGSFLCFRCVRIQSNKAAKSQKRRVSIYLVCNPNNSSPDWSVTTSFGFRIINSWGKSRNKISTLFNHTFTSNETSKGTSGYCTWDELTAANSGFLVEGRFQIEFDLNVNSSTGIRKEKISKEKYEKYIADGELITDGKTVKVCLAVSFYFLIT